MLRRARPRSVLGAVVIALSLCWALDAAAQSRDPAAAEALFRQGRVASERGDHATACEKFRESNRLDPALGTVFNIADCEEQLGHLATAWTLFQEVVQRAPAGDDRRPIALERANALERRVPRLRIALGAAPEGTKIVRNGVELGTASLDTALPVDPGEQRVVVSAPGREDAVFTISVAEGRSETLSVEAGPERAGGLEPQPDEGTVASRSSAKRTLGWVIGGVGVVGVGVGAVTGAMVLGKKSTVDEHCDPVTKRCDSEGADAADAGRTLGPISTVGFVVGAVGIGAGLYLVLSSDSEARPETVFAPTVGRDGARFSLTRSF